MYFDSHCHITSEALRADFDGVLSRARDAKVTRLLNIGDDLESSERALQQARSCAGREVQMWATVGIHPQNALSFNERTIATLRDMAAHPEVVAIGEIGLDSVYDDKHEHYPGASLEVQGEVFAAQLDLARELNLPVIIHNREADEAILEIIEKYNGIFGVFHCFGSSVEVAQRVLNAGFHLGFTGLVTFKNAGSVREVAKLCPLDRLLIETDSPYLAPVPFRGKTNEPSYVPYVAQTIAEVHNRTAEEIADITTANTQRLFGVE
ncbi:MAG TPA: TatD family hydrolase [Abditibacteriaceae bacterium]